MFIENFFIEIHNCNKCRISSFRFSPIKPIKKYPVYWIKHTLKFDIIIEGESALKSKQKQKTSVSTGKSGEIGYGPGGI